MKCNKINNKKVEKGEEKRIESSLYWSLFTALTLLRSSTDWLLRGQEGSLLHRPPTKNTHVMHLVLNIVVSYGIWGFEVVSCSTSTKALPLEGSIKKTSPITNHWMVITTAVLQTWSATSQQKQKQGFIQHDPRNSAKEKTTVEWNLFFLIQNVNTTPQHRYK